MLSASSWTAAKLVRGCGATGSNGATGAIGPQGPPGISTGLVLYFGLLGNIQAGASQVSEPITTTPPTTGTSANAIYSQYTGYFNEVWAPANASTVATPIGTFTTGNILPSSISAGVWNFNISTYCGNPNSASSTVGWTPVSGTVYAVITILGDGTHATIVTNDATFPTNSVDFTQFTATIPNNISISNKTTAYLSITFFAKTTVNPINATTTVFQFWSNGDSISDVITTLPTQSGPTGPTGSAGPTGSTGPQGIPGAAGAPGSTISGLPNQVSFFGSNGGLTGNANMTVSPTGLNLSQLSVGIPLGTTTNLINLVNLIPLVFFVQNGPIIILHNSDGAVVTPTFPYPLSAAGSAFLAPKISCTITCAGSQTTLTNPNLYWDQILLPSAFPQSTSINSYSVIFIA
jgi:hypothetical protein